MKKIHNHLMERSRWYATWHSNPHHHAIHYGFLVLFIGAMVLMVNKSIHAAAPLTAGNGRYQFAALHFADRMHGKADLGGDEAVQALGSDISTVARGYNMSDKQLAAAFKNDHTLRISPEALLFYREDQVPQQASTADGTLPNNPSPDDIPNSLTFFLHSRPSASAKIYINFQGAVVSNTSWNVGTTDPIIAAPFSLDSDPSFSASELYEIKTIWRSVSEDYAPFNVDVTTEPPTNYSYDPTHFTQAIVTHSEEWSPVYGGGLSYVNSFRWGNNTPVFIFTQGLSNGDTKDISEATAHEVGHSLGLHHASLYDSSCVKTAEYDTGSSTAYGAPGWAPIMGSAFMYQVTQWINTNLWPSVASSLGCTIEEDEVGIMTAPSTTTGDLRFVPDEAGSTPATSATLIRNIDASGIAHIDQAGIMAQNDTDMYRFTTAGGAVSLQVSPLTSWYYLIRGNADFRVRLYNSAMTVLAESNPPSVDVATIQTTVPAGTYYIEIAPSGYLDQSQPGGYPAEESMGQYQIIGTYPFAPDGSDTTPPTITMTAPTGTLSGITTLSATASDASGIAHVDFYADGVYLGGDATSPYSINWDSRSVADGAHILVAKAYDTVGNTTSTAPISVTTSNPTLPDTTAPLVSITTPAILATVTGNATISATATDASGVTKVEFYKGLTLIGTSTTGPNYSMSWNTLALPAGEYTLVAKAYDPSGNVGTSYPVIVNVPVQAPTVTISNPYAGYYITKSTSTVTITASATAASSPVANMKLTIDGQAITTVTGSTLNYKLSTKKLTIGQHTIVVTAQDTAGNTGSASVYVTKTS